MPAVPWCDDCSRFWNPHELAGGSRCPSCDQVLGSETGTVVGNGAGGPSAGGGGPRAASDGSRGPSAPGPSAPAASASSPSAPSASASSPSAAAASASSPSAPAARASSPSAPAVGAGTAIASGTGPEPEAGAVATAKRAPWHFKLLVVGVAGYMVYRVIWFIEWLPKHV
jgi:hypothetical protein